MRRLWRDGEISDVLKLGHNPELTDQTSSKNFTVPEAFATLLVKEV